MRSSTCGPNDEDYLDLADAPNGGPSDPGLRLPEFDGLLVGTTAQSHPVPDRAAAPEGLGQGERPVLSRRALRRTSGRELEDDHQGRRTDIEVTMLDPHPVLADDLFSDAIAATEQVLDLKITDLRSAPATLRRRGVEMTWW